MTNRIKNLTITLCEPDNGEPLEDAGLSIEGMIADLIRDEIENIGSVSGIGSDGDSEYSITNVEIEFKDGKFVADIELERDSGKFAGNDEIEEELLVALNNASIELKFRLEA